MDKTEALGRGLMTLEQHIQPRMNQYHHDYSPEKSYSGKEDSWPEFAHDNRRGHLEKNIGNEENEKDDGLCGQL